MPQETSLSRKKELSQATINHINALCGGKWRRFYEKYRSELGMCHMTFYRAINKEMLMSYHINSIDRVCGKAEFTSATKRHEGYALLSELISLFERAIGVEAAETFAASNRLTSFFIKHKDEIKRIVEEIKDENRVA
jgi:hypothetical protein